MQGKQIYNQNTKPVAEYKVVLLGNLGVGKSSFLKKFFIEESYFAQQTYRVNPLVFHTNYGPIRLNLWDSTGSDRALRESFFEGSHAAILMFDVTSRITYKFISIWYRDLTRFCQNIPIVLVGNKVDKYEERKVKPKQIIFHKKKNLQYYDISNKSNYQIEKPLLWILRTLTKDPELYLIKEMPLKPAEIEINVKDMKKLKQQWEQADKYPDSEHED